LFYNDYIMFAGEGAGSPSQYFHDTIRFLVDGGAPIGGIGEQGHFGGSPPAPEKVLAAFDRFAGFGLPIQISEFDIDTSDQELQVAYMRDFLTACFSHPALTGVMSWGFWEGRHWKPRAAMWDKAWNVRPHGKVWLDLVTREWWTDTGAMTDDRGRCVVRAFRGRHEVSAGKGAARAVTLPGGGAALRLELR
jgi:GH35 family endo-1,4-beta-xylanase